jgi:beta-lactamase regulating signal transducer with metallopeptidase domain
MTFAWFSTDMVGVALLHFIWQGIAAAAVLRIVLSVVPQSCASARYLLACLTLAGMAVMPITTMWIVTASTARTHAETARATLSDLDATSSARPAYAGELADVSPARAETRALPRGWMSWVALLWMIGVGFTSVRLAGGWWQSRRLLRHDAFDAGAIWLRSVERLSIDLGVTRRLRVIESASVQVPLVIGVLKPSILLPIGAFTGLTPAQIEAVLAHELAHVRRHDYLVNLLQSSVEALLFYHPAVWWVSNTIRVEREHCCDDLAVAACGNPLLYARALTELEARRPVRVGLAMAASTGSLLSRVRRLIGAQQSDHLASSGWIIAAVTTLMVAGSGAAGWMEQMSHVLAEPSDTPAISAARRPRATSTRPAAVPVPPAAPSPASAAPPAPPLPATPPVPPLPPLPGTIDLSNSPEAWMSRFSTNGLMTTLRGHGRIEFTDDDTDVRRLDPGGFFEIEQSRGWFSWTGATRFAVRAAKDGTISRSLVIDSKSVTPDEGRRWRKATLPTLIRQTGIGAGARIARLL